MRALSLTSCCFLVEPRVVDDLVGLAAAGDVFGPSVEDRDQWDHVRRLAAVVAGDFSFTETRGVTEDALQIFVVEAPSAIRQALVLAPRSDVGAEAMHGRLDFIWRQCLSQIFQWRHVRSWLADVSIG